MYFLDAILSSMALMYRSNRSFDIPPPDISRTFDTFAVLGRRKFDYQSLPEGGEFDPNALEMGNLNCTLNRFHMKSLASRAIMGDAVLEDFRGKDCAFVANWLRGKGLNKLCAVFEGQ